MAESFHETSKTSLLMQNRKEYVRHVTDDSFDLQSCVHGVMLYDICHACAAEYEDRLSAKTSQAQKSHEPYANGKPLVLVDDLRYRIKSYPHKTRAGGSDYNDFQYMHDHFTAEISLGRDTEGVIAWQKMHVADLDKLTMHLLERMLDDRLSGR